MSNTITISTIKPILFLLFLASLGACSGVKYVDAPPLPFQEIDYGYPVAYEGEAPKMAYIDEGSGPETLLLVHGLASNAGFWRYNISELAKSYRVIALDLPGYGKSEKGDFPYGMAWYASQIRDFIDTMQLENVTFVGHSMGGQIGIVLSILHPESIDRLVLAAPAGIEAFEQGEGDWLSSVITIEGVVTTPEPAIRENLSLNFHRWSPKWEWMVEERARMAKTPMMREFAYAVDRCVDAMLDEPTSDALDRVSHPTLIIYGQYDGLIPNRYLNPGFPSEVFEKGAEMIPQSTLIEIPDAGHLLQIERPKAFNEALLRYLTAGT